MKPVRTLIVFTVLLLFTAAGASLGVGAAPGALNLGTFERGNTYPVQFYLLTNAQNPILAGLGFSPAKRSLYQNNNTGALSFTPYDASEEPIKNWVTFPREQVVINPDEVSTVRFPNGDVVNANQQASFRVNVPDDAEPGLHAFEVKISPNTGGGGSGFGVGAIGVARPVFAFRVPGTVQRSGHIAGIAASRSNGRAQFDVLFKNTGTVTMQAQVTDLQLYNETGYYVKSLHSGPQRVPPGETKVISTYWTDDNREERKQRRVVATVDYSTGSATKEAMVTVPAMQEEETTEEQPEAEKTIPLWLIVLIVGFAFLITYYKWSDTNEY